MSHGTRDFPIGGNIKINSENSLILISGNTEQLDDFKKVIIPLAKAGTGGRSGQYLDFYKALLKALP